MLQAAAVHQSAACMRLCAELLMILQLQRQLQLCNTRRQAACVRYDDVVTDWRGWLFNMRDSLQLPTRPGFPIEVT